VPEWKEEIRRRLASLKLEPAREAEIVEELSRHLEDRYAESLANGAAPEEASRAALAELCDGELLERELRQVELPAPQEPVVLGTNRPSNWIGAFKRRGPAAAGGSARISGRQARSRQRHTIISPSGESWR